MADMSQVNLERLRGCDAMWEENKHPRADNGQFTSGSGGGGVKVTKATPGMAGGKFGALKNVSAALEGVGTEIANINHRNGNQKLSNVRRLEKKDKELDREKNEYFKHNRRLNYEGAAERLQNMGYGGLAGRVQEKGERKAHERQKKWAEWNARSKADMDEYQDREAARKKRNNEVLKGLYEKEEQLEGQNKKYQAGMNTLEQARPGIAKMRKQAKAAQPAAKPQASHPMAKEVQRDIDYWHQMQYGGNPSEKQKQDTIESMRMQYDDYLKTAEKNWKLAQSVPDLDEATRNKYKQKYETAKGKVEALKQMTAQPKQAAQPAQGTGWNRKKTVEFLNKEVLPQLVQGNNFESSDISKMVGMVEKFRRDHNPTEMKPKVENGFLSINGIKVGRIAQAIPKGSYGGGYSPGMARAEGRILARQEEDV